MKRLSFLIKISLVLLISISGILIYSSCKDEPPHFSTPKDVKDFCYFKTGSYWIYQDSLSGSMDTVRVDSSTYAMTQLLNDKGYVVQTSEVFYMSLSSSYSEYDTKLFQVKPLPVNWKDYLVMIRRVKPGKDLGFETYYRFPLELNVSFTTDNGHTMTLVKNEKDFKTFHFTQNPVFEDAEVFDTHQRNIGLTRREINNKFTLEKFVWKLVDHKVIQ